MSDPAFYIKAAQDLRSNEQQWQAYQSEGNCVLLAGPGSGKTKTLTIKLARMLTENVESPRGIACITYNNECARELETRLEALGVSSDSRVFIGTVHSFSLTQILLPYAKVAGLGLPDDFSVATRQQTRTALESAHAKVIADAGNPHRWDLPLSRHRRRFLDRTVPEWRTHDLQLTKLTEAYEAELRSMGVIDFDDMPLLAVRALRENPWLRKALVAKYPILAVDEYQDLGLALHGMVMGLCFSAGMRLFAVGDVDQSIYGFTGAHPELLRKLSEREDVETVKLGLNYRSGSQIVTASEYALGEKRGYQTPEGAPEGEVHFTPCTNGYEGQARHLFEVLLPQLLQLNPELEIGQIAILYPAAFIGDELAAVATENDYSFIRTDGNSLYPRGSRLMRWLEQCAMWCCEGWKTGKPSVKNIINEGARLFHEGVVDENSKLIFRRCLLTILWEQRDADVALDEWLDVLRSEVVYPMSTKARSLADELEVLQAFLERLGPEGDVPKMSLGDFAGMGAGLDRINLSTLHSAKGREFDVVFMCGMEEGRIPRYNASGREIREARRLFYVGFTRARLKVHLMFGANNSSRFVDELRNRLGVA
ncbi:ATP-dependent helicase [Sulfitobacter mediterraneus]|uniref:UvrD-helicase domain-containing protein n=1 Tax=Sulfitobacter mediterraneus TaxID=83219 RepID=UPI00193939F5|nr:ATP-dependent helicase [Sulfitobacter mediterraneus]MBM1567755.1 ATP-dependent helicase [Sulfitobacter mediterraneus]MBM1571561.1 ATP-dependent helicase [Sulfitobacter mediterraneus]MBM1575349.1 ATP-dependent helicase [Sulfitobacter mediterraneus]MBM1579160.1 ATP-dependent helicase [Sulfitobacter mediterraneus]